MATTTPKEPDGTAIAPGTRLYLQALDDEGMNPLYVYREYGIGGKLYAAPSSVAAPFQDWWLLQEESNYGQLAFQGVAKSINGSPNQEKMFIGLSLGPATPQSSSGNNTEGNIEGTVQMIPEGTEQGAFADPFCHWMATARTVDNVTMYQLTPPHIHDMVLSHGVVSSDNRQLVIVPLETSQPNSTYFTWIPQAGQV